jgi:hypothetical protein
MMTLENKTHLAIAKKRKFFGIKLTEVTSVKKNSATGGLVKRTYEVEQGAFAATRGANNGNRFAPCHLEDEPLQYPQRFPVLGRGEFAGDIL